MKYLFFFTFNSLTPVALADSLYFWNVGQGQWSTHVTPENCFHFDMGGEKSPLQRIKQLCRGKREILFLSHWDWDHRSFVVPYSRGQNICIVSPIRAPIKKPILRECSEVEKKLMLVIFNGQFSGSSNATSRVFYNPHFQVLFPGDSPKKEEKIWSSKIPRSLKTLALSHHGSRSSTSQFFLKHSIHLQQAIASCRFEKYGHPHQEVAQRLKKNRIALLTTEDWGNIIFQREF